MITGFKKHSGLITIIGIILFLPTFSYITYEINQNNLLQQLSDILRSMDMNLLKEFYRNHPTSLLINLLDYICIIGYGLIFSGTIAFYNTKYPNQKKIKSVNTIAFLLGILVGIVDIVETTITVVGSLNNFDISNEFMYMHAYGTYFKGLIWIIFLWVLILCIVMLSNLFRACLTERNYKK